MHDLGQLSLAEPIPGGATIMAETVWRVLRPVHDEMSTS